ncbi:MAG: hypothetical protein KZQ77_02500 [Candidatus Thiodiazotropha sp. (ex Notomyrtea botanica)]|nr:hypothetical protein [Candidatus Thiodiazotropha sp. (ex Notomyrtea botanica)]
MLGFLLLSLYLGDYGALTEIMARGRAEKQNLTLIYRSIHHHVHYHSIICKREESRSVEALAMAFRIATETLRLCWRG